MATGGWVALVDDDRVKLVDMINLFCDLFGTQLIIVIQNHVLSIYLNFLIKIERILQFSTDVRKPFEVDN